MVVDAVSNEKGVDKEVIFEALEAALAVGYPQEARRRMGRARRHRPQERRLRDLPPLESVRRRFHRARSAGARAAPGRRARPRRQDVEPGGFVEQPMESVAFGRIAAQQAKQVIVQKVREAERAQVVDAYKDRVGTLVSGVVKRVDRNGIYVDLGSNAEGFVPRTDMIPREQVKPQDRIKAFLKEVRLRAARPAAVPDAHRAGIPHRAVQARSAGSGPGPHPDPRRRARCGRPRQDRGAQQRSAHRSGRRLRRHARLARAGGLERDRRRARGHHSVRREPGAVRDQRDVAGRSACPSSSTRTRTAWISRWPRTSCRRPSAAAARTSASRASSPAGT